MAQLKIALEVEETSFIDTFDAPLSDRSRMLYEELLSATKESGTKFTRLAYKAGESAIRQILANRDYGLWEDYLSALKALGTAGAAVRSLAVSVARFVMGGRKVNKEGNGYYFVPTSSFFSSYKVDGDTVWEFDFKDSDPKEAVAEALQFARDNKGKLFCFDLKREPVKKGPLDAFADRARDIRFTLASDSKKDRAAKKRILDQIADSGLSEEQFGKALALLARIKNVSK